MLLHFMHGEIYKAVMFTTGITMKLHKVTYTNDCLDECETELLLESGDLCELKEYAQNYAKKQSDNSNNWELLGRPTMGNDRIVRDDKQKLHISEKVYLLIE